MNATKDDRIEKLIKKFMKEALSRNMENFSQRKKGQGSGFEEMFDMFKDFAEMVTGEDSNTIDIEEEEVSVNKKTEDIDNRKEVKLLKEQIEILKQQLKDKDDIISLLKEQKSKA